MSLLNQVLQDLEKRNDENGAEDFSLGKLKVVTVTQKKSFYLPLSIILVISIFGISLYKANEKITPALEIKSEQGGLTEAKQWLTVKPTIIQIKTPEKKKYSIEKLDSTKQQNLPSPIIENETKHNKTEKQQAIKLSTARVQKSLEVLSEADKKSGLKTPVIKKLSQQQKAEQYYKHAQAQQNSNRKQQSLEQALTLNPKHINARLLLANTLLKQGLSNKAAELLDQGLGLFPQNLQMINHRSQLYLQNKQAPAALKILQRIDDAYVKNETYLSLLAAAYQQDNASLSSLQTYKKLLKINPEKAEYWLGLAIAMEKQSSAAQALAAYQQALDKKTLTNAIVSYIEQRMSILN